MDVAVESVASAPLYPFARPTPLVPAGELARLRAETPVARVRSAEGDPAWLVTRYDDARTVLGDHRRFALALPGGGVGGGGGQGANYSLFQDPPGHTRLRRLVNTAFTARRVAGLRARTKEIVDALVADMVAGDRTVDLMEAFAFPFPIILMGELLGVPEAERDSFRVWSSALMSIHSQGAPTAGAGWGNLTQQVSDLIARKRRDPGDDVLSALITARDTDRLSLPELVTMAITLIIAGTAAISVATASGTILLTGRGQLARLATDPALAKTAVDEVLRFQSATGDIARTATEDLELAGVRIRAGDKVVVSVASANRDERRFTDPDRFDIERTDNAPMTFSHGIHHCLGAALSRMELEVVFTTFAERFPGLRVAVETEELTWHRSEFFGDEWPEVLPVSW